MKLKFNTLGQKIGSGYGLVIIILAFAVGLTLWQIKDLHQLASRITNQSVPTTKMCLEISDGVNHSIATLRGWMMLNDSTFKKERRAVWANKIRSPFNKLKELNRRRPDSINKARLDALESRLNQLEKYQDQVESLSLKNDGKAIQLLESSGLKEVSGIRTLLDLMVKEVEGSMKDDFNNIDDQISSLSNLEWMLLGTGILISLLMGIVVTSSITRPVGKAVHVADNIAAGDLSTEVAVTGSRELNSLGDALLKMRNSLKARAHEAERYNWLSSGQNKLNEVMRGDKDLNDLASSIITFMAEYTGASVGVLLLMNDNKTELSVAGKYAFQDKRKGTLKFKMGEGLVGQVAVSQKPISIDHLSDSELNISSSMVDIPPSYVSISPFIFEGHTLGVIELGKRSPFDEKQQSFIALALESIAIAMNSARAQQRIRILLEETKRQSEELQVQQEELQQSNEELEEQAQNLKVQQEELQASNEELEEQAQIVEQKNKDLEAARLDIELKAKQLEISSKYKSEFLANMSHELRTPLNSLLILSNDLSENKEANLTADQVESAQVIAKSGRDLLLLINEILDLSKIEAGKMDLNLEEFRISDLAESVLGSFKRVAHEKGIKFNVNVHQDLPPFITTDSQRLEQILKNLVSNAIKFTEKGQVSVDFNRSAGGYLQVAVADTGIGIPKDKQQIIFEAFQQADGSTARKYGGTGLGLSISRELARFLSGKITVSSTPGKGSVFNLLLPLESATTEKVQVTEVRTLQTLASEEAVDTEDDRFLNYPTIKDNRNNITAKDETVLIIEDDQSFAQILANQATQKGFKYISAATGEDGLKLAEKYFPQAIILDLDLPGINGHAVLKMLKANPELRHIPVHIMSVNEKTIDPIKSGAVEYLTKPVSKPQLEKAFSRIEEFINRKMKNLLIVEDDKNLRRSIVKLIGGDGDVHCIEAGSAREAITNLSTHQIDCMVLDIGLPDMNGFELIKNLEADKKIKLPPIIVYTGRELSKKENDELQQYAETIIVKGVKSEERLLDETALFLHRMVKNLPSSKRQMINGLYDQEKLFADKKILLVDDDMRNVWALSKVLGNKGLEIIKADNGRSALKILEGNEDVDMVLMDIMMPEMDGYECMQEIRKLHKYYDLPIIALTAKAMKEDRQMCIAAGANDYITKPVDVGRLISMINIWMNK